MAIVRQIRCSYNPNGDCVDAFGFSVEILSARQMPLKHDNRGTIPFFTALKSFVKKKNSNLSFFEHVIVVVVSAGWQDVRLESS